MRTTAPSSSGTGHSHLHTKECREGMGIGQGIWYTCHYICIIYRLYDRSGALIIMYVMAGPAITEITLELLIGV